MDPMTAQTPAHPTDVRAGTLRSIANSVEPAFPDAATDLRFIASTLEQHIPSRDEIRAAISTAYYDARNTGGTMETAADRAADAVAALGVGVLQVRR
jgi:hypothetical protein